MCFKKICFRQKANLRFFLLSFLILTPSSVLGIEIPGSGIDWGNSTMQVEFDKEVSGVRNSTCFGDLSPYYTNNTTVSPYDDLNRTVSLDLLGYSDENYDPIIPNCFLEAGDYRVTITTQDFASNITILPPIAFSVMAGSPAQYEADGITPASTFTQISCTSPVANNSDTCSFQLSVRDQYLNPVTQLDAFATGKIYSDSIFPEDANKGLSFRDGLVVDSSDLGDSTAKNDFTLSLSGGVISKTFSFRAKAPSIARSGDFRGVNQAFQIDFDIDLPSIDASGAIDTGNLVTFSFDEFSQNIQFLTPIESYIEIDGTTTPSIIIGTTSTLNIAKSTQLFGGAEPSSVDLYLEYHGLPYTLAFYDTNTTPALDTDTFMNQDYSNDHSFAGSNPPVTRDFKILGSGAGATTNPENLAIASDVAYDLSGVSIRYPSGAIGDPGITLSLLGASIEGLSQTKSDYFINLDNTNKSDYLKGFLVGNVKYGKDIREQIYRNTFTLIRTLEPVSINSLQQWFKNNANHPKKDHTVIVAEEGDVTLNANEMFLPPGKRTLVIRNGNLILKGNLGYKYVNRLDSFAFILINDTVEPLPNTGNVLIENEVSTIAGTYVLDGAMISVQKNDDTMAEAEQGFGMNDTHQLLLDGVLLSHNTLGGAYDSLFAGANIPDDFDTPWGTVAELKAAGMTPPFGRPDTDAGWDEVAKLYDLHLIRQWQHDGPNASNCAEEGSPAACISNKNAFVIRVDNKVTQLPPPGFKSLETIIR